MAETINSIASVLWPLLIFAALLVFRRPLLRIVRSAEKREWTLEIGGQKLSMKQVNDQQNKVLADLQKQVAALNKAIDDTASGEPEAGSEDAAVRPGKPYSVLWVDDFPENNALIIEQLQDRGVRVDLAHTTTEGLRLLGQRDYGAVLSDMSRDEDGTEVVDAGLRLLRAVRQSTPDIPFVIYCNAGASSKYRAEALAEGATAITASPTVVTEHLRALGLLD
ncbi:response regulator [Amycolatopsis sp. NPDC059021]|uniref:response regulator n=1 Tax=Amycolatopsis sp. NPDC059021 TaxID=3346704 RepID=UPI00366D7DCD